MQPNAPTLTPAEQQVGKGLSRVDGRLKVTGGARYAAEGKIDNPLHAVLVTSQVATGTVSAYDLAAASKAPGVIKIITPDNMPKLKKPKGAIGGDARMPLSDMKILYHGQALAVVIADTLEHAREGARLVKVKVSEGPSAIVDYHDPRAKVEKPPQNMGEPLQVTMGNPDAALAMEGVVAIKEVYETPVETHNPMEMHATLAAWSEGGKALTVWDATQWVSGTQNLFAEAFGLKPDDVRVLCPFIGGGFGCKGANWPHVLLTAAAAAEVKRPVKCMLTRAQMFYGTGHRPPTTQTMTLGATKDGKLVALKHETKMRGSFAGEFVEPTAMGTSRVLYTVPAMGISHEVARTNVGTATFMRAPGETPGTFALESAMDELAIKLGVDPIALRLTNHADVHPATKKPFSTKHLKECYAVGAEKFGWAKRNATPGSMKDAHGRRMGWGMATATYPGYRFGGTARLRLVKEEGGFKVVGQSATHDLGTGAYTIFTQICADLTGMPMDKVRFELGDSQLPVAPVAGGSNSTASIAQALSDAAQDLRNNLLKLAGDTSPLKGLEAWNVNLLKGKLVSVDDPSKSEDVAALLAKSERAYVEGMSTVAGKTNAERVSKQGTAGGEDYAGNAQKYAFHSHGAHFVEVVIDDLLPRVTVTRVVSVIDIGRVMNAKTARSQVLGGVTMGIGMALMEETLYDPTTAKVVTDNLADYPVPVNPDIHDIDVTFVGEPDFKLNALGARGVGEIGITGVAAAVANAVYHATGKRIRSLPITPDKLL